MYENLYCNMAIISINSFYPIFQKIILGILGIFHSSNGKSRGQETNISTMAAAMDVDDDMGESSGLGTDKAGKKRFEVKKVTFP